MKDGKLSKIVCQLNYVYRKLDFSEIPISVIVILNKQYIEKLTRKLYVSGQSELPSP